MAMKSEIKTRWVAKLREPGRRQTRNKLRDASGAQCCLDVLCEVAVEDGVIAPPVLNFAEDGYGYVWVDSDGDDYYQTDVLPKDVREWAGLDYTDPMILGGDERKPASWYNDSVRMTFPEIADLIEADEEL